MNREPRDRDGPSSAAPPSLQPDERLADRYRVQRCLGQGGMGEVYAVFDEQLGEEVALKLMTLAATDEAGERFRSEVRLARRITHANVARTHDIGTHNGQLFLTMERIDGTSLEHHPAPVSPTEAARIVSCVAQGLVAAHAAGVVHRDLKPGNVLMSNMGRVAITDFGVARELMVGRRAKSSRVVGTPEYMAPEQILGLDISPATDVYALGILLYELLTGCMPFEGPNPMAAAYARCHVDPIDARAHNANLPDALCALITRCLSRDPLRRPTAKMVAMELEAAFDSVQVTRDDKTIAQLRASAGTIAASDDVSGWPLATGVLVSQPVAPLEPGNKTLGVLPFSYRGPASHDHLGASVSQELIDVLARTRGLRVLAFGATAACGDQRDPRTVGKELGADVIVNGTIFAQGDRVRISVRLVDVATGEQIWTDRYEGDLGDVLSMEEVMSQRIAETLRLELTMVTHSPRATPQAMSDYLRARRELNQRQPDACERAVVLLDQAIAASPSFGPALAAHAVASVRLWWFKLLDDNRSRLCETAVASVARAMSQAPDLAETHLAAGVLALHQGDFKTTARELIETLAIAPTCAEAHRYLGELQCEAGRVAEGMRRVTLACELDPTTTAGHYVLARMAFFRGEDERGQDYLQPLVDRFGAGLPAIILTRVRVAGWKRDEAALRGYAERMERMHDGTARMVAIFARTLLGELDVAPGLQMVELIASSGNLRMTSLMRQLAVEVLALRGDVEPAMQQLESLSAAGLVDMEWLRRCPALAPLRSQPGFAAVTDRVSDRLAEIWAI